MVRAARDVPADMAARLIVALDVDSVAAAEAMAERLDGVVSFFKIGLWLQFAPGVDRLIDTLLGRGKQIFLDAKMFDIPQTVAKAVEVAAARGVSFITVHGDEAIMRAAVQARGKSALKVFAVTVLTSLDDEALRFMGYSVGARELVQMRAARAVACGCDGVIASANDNPDGIRSLAHGPGLLIATPGVRQAQGSLNDHKRSATPGEAIRNGADYLVVGRPIVEAADPVAAARSFVREMEAAQAVLPP
jgi:orotidine-5'-phosphate decarboxylase